MYLIKFQKSGNKKSRRLILKNKPSYLVIEEHFQTTKCKELDYSAFLEAVKRFTALTIIPNPAITKRPGNQIV